MKTTKAKTAVITAVTALLLTACGSDSDTSGNDSNAAGGDGPSGTVRVNWGSFPETWAPGSDAEPGYLRVPYESLTRTTRDGEIEPMLASEWEQTDDALTLTLAQDVTFHDGTPFDAEAVKTNLEAVRDTPGPYSGPLQPIESIDVVDEHTVRLNLSESTPSLLNTLSTRAGMMRSPDAIAGGSIATEPVGTGPWAYDADASSPGTRLVFTLYEDYWGGTDSVGVETIELYALPDDQSAVGALSTGEIDISDVDPSAKDRADALTGVESFTYATIRNNPLFFDRGPGGVFEDVRVRQAFCYALDTDALAGLGRGQIPTTQHFAEGELGYNPDIEGYPHDLDQARELYEEAGSPPVEAEVLAAPFTQNQLSVYADQVSELGMQLNVQVVPPPQWVSEWSSGRYPLGLASQDEQTPFEWYKAWFAADAPGNPAGVESEELKAAADAAIAAGLADEAADLWAEVTRIISEEALTCAHVVGQQNIYYRTDTVAEVEQAVEPWEPNSIDYRSLRLTGGE
jgi:peptide/nickel transport system substrate-binding protein